MPISVHQTPVTSDSNSQNCTLAFYVKENSKSEKGTRVGQLEEILPPPSANTEPAFIWHQTGREADHRRINYRGGK